MHIVSINPARKESISPTTLLLHPQCACGLIEALLGCMAWDLE